jgi:hypothetical protein
MQKIRTDDGFPYQNNILLKMVGRAGFEPATN